MLDSGTIQKKINDMPPLSDGAHEMLAVVAGKEHEPEDIVTAVERDSVLTASVLRVVNSAAFALAREISTVKDAVAYLGDMKVVGIAMAAAGKATFNTELKGYRGSRGDLGRHCLLTAMTARELTRHTHGAVDPGIAYTAGLLHDIGKVIISDCLDQVAADIFASLDNETMPDFRAAEQHFLGTDHCDAGHEVGNEWSLPYPLLTGIKYHHLPAEAEACDRPLAYVVHLADMVVMNHGVGTGMDAEHYHVDRAYIDHIRIEEDELEELMPRLEADFARTAGALFG